ncbi:MAG: toprim domain-containing protein, partial [Desulfuromonadales bacterium]|nr:toprim domain-containing protein [Desulfuromonadales bacterium]NIS44129.1 toprim domain-containing protein [Desulfuromonadales bacterium]
LYRAGIENVVATCGTALTEDHARMVRRYADTVRLLFDQDEAGRTATFRAMEALLPAGLSVSVVALEAGDDPDTFLAREGGEAFAERLAQARPVMEFFIDVAFDEGGDSVEGQARAAEQVAGKLSLLSRDFERDLYLKKLAERSGIDVELLRRKQEEAAKKRASAPRRPASPPSPQAPPPVPPSQAPPPEPPAPQGRARPEQERQQPTVDLKAQHMLLSLMFWEAAHRRRVAEEGPEKLFADPAARALAARILTLYDEREEWSREELIDRLSADQKSLLSGILLEKEVLEE